MRITGYTSIFSGILLVIVTGCMNTKTVIRNYDFATADVCDCYTRHPLILIGTQSQYFSKETAFCTRLNFIARRDSIFLLNALKYRMEEESEAQSQKEEDSIQLKIQTINKSLLALKSGWTHAKIKTKWRGSAEGTQIIKRKVKFYNKFNSGRKEVGKEKYIGDSLVKSTPQLALK